MCQAPRGLLGAKFKESLVLLIIVIYEYYCLFKL